MDVLSTFEPVLVREVQTEATEQILIGYGICVVVLVVVAPIQLIAKDRRSALKNILFALAAVLVFFFLLPMCALASR